LIAALLGWGWPEIANLALDFLVRGQRTTDRDVLDAGDAVCRPQGRSTAIASGLCARPGFYSRAWNQEKASAWPGM